MSWSNLARGLHDELCDALHCEEYIGDDSSGYIEHNLRREFWEGLVEPVKEWAVSMVHADPRDILKRDLAAYIHGDTCTCPYSVEDADLARADALIRGIEADALDAEELDPGSPWNAGGAS